MLFCSPEHLTFLRYKVYHPTDDKQTTIISLRSKVTAVYQMQLDNL